MGRDIKFIRVGAREMGNMRKRGEWVRDWRGWAFRQNEKRLILQ